ncbi:MBL fold metallo-hydrolase [Amycolatopsis thermophila]|uniref:Glyoxylase-like metal-dependent hydrolase (Beta-lactamase superfamily II) n=1 Tax=Amycolatopsis thermophila TaxID=206084 RepID=A0ABU0F3L6_9PSEU|nr:MBL fold metallo-hydrolase [Amycolatopsis thermophila]MDQ0381939.1 glyoxylase-like metal-dependent hydrolase (beta-lactamase superfamily II) [Amycolatopsis thermophila]
MLVVGFGAGALQANCYLLAPGADTACVVVDPGQDSAGAVAGALAEHRLTPVAVLATHGHPDHVADAALLTAAHDVPMWIHPADRGLYDGGEPADVRELTGAPLELADLVIEVDPAPGHTAGSVVFRVATPEGGRLALTGDTLFAGSIGRGDHRRLGESLRDVLLPLPDDTVVLPGHGPATTIGRERAGNPFLSGARSVVPVP